MLLLACGRILLSNSMQFGYFFFETFVLLKLGGILVVHLLLETCLLTMHALLGGTAYTGYLIEALIGELKWDLDQNVEFIHAPL